MVSDKMKVMVENGSQIRSWFEEGTRLANLYGRENVFDFTLGNPNLPAPKEVNDAFLQVLQEEDSVELHGYTKSNAGYMDVRQSVAESLNKRFGMHFTGENIIMTTGAAMAMNVIMKVLLNPEDEVVVLAPYFGEYRSYVSNFNGKIVEVPADDNSFQPNMRELENSITKKTKIVIVNSPNNPSGVVYSEETIEEIARILLRKQEEFGSQICLLSDEPYRELVYGDIKVPYLPQYYKNTAVCYSFSKSLSLPGERIGYLVISNEMDDSEEIIEAACIANRIIGSVNAPTLQQKMIKKCLDVKVDISFYEKNRDELYNGLQKMGYECVKPDGAFYMFVKSPTSDENEFCLKAKEHNILIVPGSSFSCPGYVRIAYCVSRETIIGALPKFEILAKEYELC